MLEYINLKNFKSIQNLQLPLKKINVFIGPNGSGKSSISQSIALLKQSSHDVTWDGDSFNLGSFEKIVNNQSKEKKIEIQFGGWFPPINNIGKIFGTKRIVHGFHFGINEKGLSEIGYKLDGYGFFDVTGTIRRTTDVKEQKFEFEGVEISFIEKFDLTNFLEVRGGSHSKKSYEFYEKVHNALQAYLATNRNQLEYCKFIPATRGFDQTWYQLLDEVSFIQTSKGLTRQAEMAATSMAHNSEIEDKITNLIKKVLPDIQIKVRNLPQRRIQIVNKDKFGEYSITNEGFGLNQSIYLFMQFALSEKYSTLFIDEPEISLHPFSQSKLASVLVEESLKDEKQLIITTHSEHILLGMLEAVMQKRLRHDFLGVYYFEKIDGITKVTKIDVTENGELKGGMKGFFEADLEHFDKFIESVKKKK